MMAHVLLLVMALSTVFAAPSIDTSSASLLNTDYNMEFNRNDLTDNRNELTEVNIKIKYFHSLKPIYEYSLGGHFHCRGAGRRKAKKSNENWQVF